MRVNQLIKSGLWAGKGLWVLCGCCQAMAGEFFGDRVRLGGSMDNARIAFERSGRGNVVFMGGSITEMDGYRPMVCDGLRKRFPGTEFTFTNAGISSTTSTTGAFRLERDVLSRGPVDLFFVEFAVNDDQDGHYSREECVRGLEGIIRHLWRVNPKTDIVVTFFVNEGMLETFGKGGDPLTIEAHARVAGAYGLSTINLAREIWMEIGSGALTWEVYGGVHPAPAGNAICARMIGELFDRAWVEPLGENAAIVPHVFPAAPMDMFSYGAGRFIAPARAKVSEGWEMGVPDWAQLEGGKRERFTSIPMLCSTKPGAEAVLSFEGTAVGAYVVAGPDAGMVEVRVDDGPVGVVDLYHEYSRGLHYPRTVMFGTELRPGRHTLVVRVSDRTGSGGHAVRVMEFVAN